MTAFERWLVVTLALILGTAKSPAAAEMAAPSYVWHNVVMGGGGFVTGLIAHPHATNLFYARTDVGGAYRWNDAAQTWVPLTDWISPADNNLTGIESLALDPSDPRRVYLAAGMYHQGQAAILRSDDQGQTFVRTDVPFNMGGNESGRFNGERLAVDPNAGEILLFGSRRDGLWRSGDRAKTWQRVAGFPAVGLSSARPPSTDTATNSRPRFGRGFGRLQAVGIVSVLFDPASGHPGQATPKIFAAVSTTGTNFYVSTNAGLTWVAVARQPVGLCPNHLVRSSDGTLYLTYGKEPGPNIMSDGAVWKFDPEREVWKNITPLIPAEIGESFGYGALAVDSQHPATVMVTTFDHWHSHDLIFRSQDGGASWAQLWHNDTQWDHASAPYTKNHPPHWMGTLLINPFNSDQVWFTTGYGLWSSLNATAADSGAPTRWVFQDAGLEETVPLALISPPAGAHLLSGLGDIDGFRHDDVDVSPPTGTFKGPRFSNTEDLAFAWKNPQVMVRSGTTDHPGVRAAYSRDGGANWQALAGEPPGGEGGGAITMSAGAQTIVWTPRGSAPYITKDWGAHWTACAGLSTGDRVVADTVNPLAFYAFTSGGGICYASTNGAAIFSPRATVLGPQNNNPYAYGGATLTVTPGRENDLWLVAHAQGLFHSTNGGVNFVKIEAVQEAGSLGLGKAAAGKNFPALYLAGRIGGAPALFRSDDEGQSWGRINDDQHQYGFISHVTGDPRIYGRVYFGTGGRGVIYGDINPNPAVSKNNF